MLNREWGDGVYLGVGRRKRSAGDRRNFVDLTKFLDACPRQVLNDVCSMIFDGFVGFTQLPD